MPGNLITAVPSQRGKSNLTILSTCTESSHPISFAPRLFKVQKPKTGSSAINSISWWNYAPHCTCHVLRVLNAELRPLIRKQAENYRVQCSSNSAYRMQIKNMKALTVTAATCCICFWQYFIIHIPVLFKNRNGSAVKSLNWKQTRWGFPTHLLPRITTVKQLLKSSNNHL